MNNLPTSWVETNLGTVVPYGATAKAEPEDLKPDTWVLELEDIEKDSTKVLQRLTFSQRQSKSTKNRFDAGDVLYGKLRPYLNKVTFADQPGVCTTEIVPIKPTEAVNGRYLFHWLRHPKFLTYVTEVSHGVNMPRLGTEAGRQAPIVLAPKNEQKRIADKLDTVLTRVDAVNARVARVAPILKRFRQSVLAAATSGRLTIVEQTQDESADWPKVHLGDVCSKITDGEHSTPKRSSSGKFLLSARNVRDGEIALKNVDFVDQSEFDRLRLRCDPSIGDVLLSCSGSVGRAALVDRDDAYVMVRSAALIRPDAESLLPKFLMFALQSPQLQQQILEASRSTAQANIFLGPIKRLTIALPPLTEQAEIVRRVETLFAFADRLETRLQTAQTATERLTPAMLAKAFRGELVPQDPNDEPASELLRRLQQEAPSTSTRRGRKSAA